MRTTGFSITAVILLLVPGCGPAKNLAEKETVYVRETETVTLVDTVIQWRIPEGAESSVLPDTDTSRLKTALAESEAWVKDGQLHHELRNRSDLTLPIPLVIPMRATETEHGLIREKTVTVEVEKPLNWWRRFWIRFGQVSAALLTLLLHFILIRKNLVL